MAEPIDMLIAELRKMALCVYLAIEQNVADDLAGGLNRAAAALSTLSAERDALIKTLGKAAPFIGWASTRHQIIVGVDANELCDEIDAALKQGDQQWLNQ